MNARVTYVSMSEALSARHALRGSRMFRNEPGYVAFEAVISRVEAWVDVAVFDVLGYRGNSLARRLVQRVVEIGGEVKPKRLEIRLLLFERTVWIRRGWA